VLTRGEDRAILTAPGTIAALRRDLVQPDLVRTARHVHVASYFLQLDLRGELLELFRDAHGAGVTTSIDPNWDPTEGWDGGLLPLLEHTDLFFPNAAEARAITGIEEASVAAQALAERGPVVAMKFGRDGGLVVAGTEAVRCRSVPIDAKDTTGAGDSFDAGFLAGRLEGWDLDRCLALAVACGALSTRALGGTGGQPTMEEALAAMEVVP
jgi:sugar/nucleoside kinase (ribokinase family)